eukprot:Rmarinus@m.17436
MRTRELNNFTSSRRKANADSLRKDKRELAMARRRKVDTGPDPELLTPAALEKLTTAIRNEVSICQTQTTLLDSLRTLRRVLSVEDAPVEAVLGLEGVALLIQLLQFPSPDIQAEAAWSLANVAYCGHNYAATVMPAAPHLIHLLSAPDPNVVEQCAWALGNLAGDSRECREQLLANGAIGPLITCLSEENVRMCPSTVVSTALWCLANLAQGPDPPLQAFDDAGAFSALVRILLTSVEPKPIVEASWVLSHLTSTSETHINRLCSLGIMNSLAAKFVTDDVQILQPLLRVLGNVNAATKHADPIFLSRADIVRKVVKCLSSEHRAVVKEAAWILSNIFCGEPDVLAKFYEAGAVDALVSVLNRGFDIKREAVFALANLVSNINTGEAPQRIVALGGLPAILSVLGAPDVSASRAALAVVGVVLARVPEGPRIVEEARGIEALESVMYSENQVLHDEANELIEKYYSDVPKDDGDVEVARANLPPWRIR